MENAAIGKDVDEMMKKTIGQISNWFEFDLKRPESQYVEKLERARTIATSLRDLISNRSDCTISIEDLNVMFFYPHLDFILEFHSFWNEKRLKRAHEAWKNAKDLSRCLDAFNELSGGRGRPLTRYTPLLQAKWDSDRVFRRLKEDELILERLKRDKVSVAELQSLLCVRCVCHLPQNYYVSPKISNHSISSIHDGAGTTHTIDALQNEILDTREICGEITFFVGVEDKFDKIS